MRKKFFWALCIQLILLIGTLWGIEVTNEQKLQKVKAEARAIQALYEQVDQTISTIHSYEATRSS
ncbi:hypothetical protein [Pontibacillus sp. HMF3514]|uniref:hypothetical protein n=1 Tax=Pontibacillus sp. HMF3514 TaxID=2692425 RepID=UPI00131F92BA|nr:hypothetical protein [Pontibacillus sp. HMF3514]QHE51578.1 hypothetical protein GS400_05805 [Pontibacillus sp. HMF3514]